MLREVFSVKQVSEICGEEPRIVIEWFNSMRLEGYRIGNFRRIPHECLIKFLKQNNMPIPDELNEKMTQVLIVSQDQLLIQNLRQNLSEKSFQIRVALSGFRAGVQAERFRPDGIICDFAIGEVEALRLCQNLKKDNVFEDIILAALLNDDSASFDQSGIDLVYSKGPLDASHLVEQLQSLIDAKKELT